MYENLFLSLREHLAATIILFVILINIITYLLIRNKIGSFYLGALMTLASLFYSLLLYLKEAFLVLSDFGNKGEKEFSGSKQYLLNKFLIFAQLLLVVISLSIIAVGIVSAWNNFLPPKYLRDRITELEATVSEKKNELTAADSKIQQTDKDWADKKDQLINNFKNEKKNELQKAVSDNKSLEPAIYNNPEINNIFLAIKSYLDNNNGSLSGRKYAVIKYINQQYIGADAANILRIYTDNWYAAQTTKEALEKFSEDNLRLDIQPDLNMLKQTSSGLNSIISRWEDDLKNLNAEIKYNFSALALTLLSSLLQCIITIWIIGIALELLGLSINMAGDIREMRSKINDTPAL
ncbi:MAG: hypothetical protein WCJ01_10125 [Ignavibacteria bacterium]